MRAYMERLGEDRAVAAFVAASVAAFTLHSLASWSGALPGNDDMMRLMQVRGLMDGQGWFDVHQERFVTPEGGAMHWSRIPDVAISGLIAFFDLFTGRAQAEHLALLVWPRLVLAACLAGLAVCLKRLGAGLVGTLGGLVFFLASHAMVQVQPGRIDHHGLELALVLGALAALLGRGAGWKSGAFAGLCVAAMLSVAIESLPYAAALVALSGMMWIVRGEAGRGLIEGLGAALVAGSLAAFVLDAPGAGAARIVCDAFGTFHLGGLVGGGLALVALSFATPRLASWRVRLMAGMGAGALAAIIAVAVNPACLGSPYGAVDSAVMTEWMASVTEARHIGALFATSPAFGVGVFGFALAALVGLALTLRAQKEGEILPRTGVLALLVIAVLVMSWQVRAVMFAHGFAALAVGVTISALVPFLMKTGEARVLAAAALLLLAPTSWKTLGLAIAPPQVERTEGLTARANCRSAETLAALDALPTARVFAPIDLGTAILVHTDHSIFAAPYHRNMKAIAGAVETFQASPEEARTRLEAMGADYVYACPQMGEIGLYARRAPGSLAEALKTGELPDWLEPVGGAEGDALVLRVRRAEVATAY